MLFFKMHSEGIMSNVKAFLRACKNNNTATCTELLKEAEVLTELRNSNKALEIAARNGAKDVIPLLLATDIRPVTWYSFVTNLLSYPQYIDASANNNRAYRLDIKYGFPAAAAALMKAPNVHLAFSWNTISTFSIAVENGQLETAMMLLAQDGVKHIVSNHPELIVSAVKSKSEPMLDLVLNIPGMDAQVAANQNAALTKALQTKNAGMTRKLLAKQTVVENATESHLLLAAENINEIDIFSSLLQSKAIQDKANILFNKTLVLAINSGHTQIVVLLLGMDAIKQSLANIESPDFTAVRDAYHQCKNPAIRELLCAIPTIAAAPKPADVDAEDSLDVSDSASCGTPFVSQFDNSKKRKNDDDEEIVAINNEAANDDAGSDDDETYSTDVSGEYSDDENDEEEQSEASERKVKKLKS
jgi:hypothetical protein